MAIFNSYGSLPEGNPIITISSAPMTGEMVTMKKSRYPGLRCQPGEAAAEGGDFTHRVKSGFFLCSKMWGTYGAYKGNIWGIYRKYIQEIYGEYMIDK